MGLFGKKKPSAEVQLKQQEMLFDQLWKMYKEDKDRGLSFPHLLRCLAAGKMVDPLPDEYEADKPPKTKAQLIAEAEQAFKEMKDVIDVAYFEDEGDRTMQLKQLYRGYNQKLTNISESQTQ